MELVTPTGKKKEFDVQKNAKYLKAAKSLGQYTLSSQSLCTGGHLSSFILGALSLHDFKIGWLVQIVDTEKEIPNDVQRAKTKQTNVL